MNNLLKVVMLPQTKQNCQKGDILLSLEDISFHLEEQLEFYQFDFTTEENPNLLDKRLQPQHLYLISDDEIKELP